jgi:hypothetical protein
MSAPWTVRGRELVLNGFQDLPNVLMIGSLVLGGISGSMPLIIMGLGALATTGGYLAILNAISSYAPSYVRSAYDLACISHKANFNMKDPRSPDTVPSTWLFTVSYFIGYLLFNAGTIITLNPTNSDDVDKVNTRQAQGISIMIALIIMFLMFVVYRYRTKCETLFTTIIGALLGLGIGIGVFNGFSQTDLRIADVLQIRQGMEPSVTSQYQTKPIMCTAE